MKTIIYTCPYVPAEWIAAHGLHASRIMPAAAGVAGPFARIEGICPYVRGFVNKVLTNERASGIVVTTACDQMRRAFDIIKHHCKTPAFLMNIPSTWGHLAVHKLYLDELSRLGLFLCQLGGKTPKKNVLAKTMLEYDATRTSILAAKGNLTPRQYSQAIAQFGRSGKYITDEHRADPELSTSSVPLAIIGGPLFKQDFEIFDVVENCGGRIVLDATETGQRRMCAAFNHRRLRDDPVLELCDAYFGDIPDASRRPNSRLYTWLEQQLKSMNVRGIIFRRHLWCDIWHAELHRLKQFTALPVLDFDASGDEQALSIQAKQRICAFLEMLQ
ncbi:MAG: 2-hydroxyacyl-CoA dehydratase [Planctomycetota bacterium]|jgi:benzoyl-CoA reductase/2-hydroxyglutaryl-CoA dehydratase subunit BcrC/BadD/HgdB